MLKVQSVRVSKKFSKKKADEIVRKMGYKVTPVNKNNPQYKNYHSYRQVEPKKFKKDSFRVRKLDSDVLHGLGSLT